MGQLNPQVLCDAITRNLTAVVSLPSAGMFRHHKSRLLAADELSIWVETILSERPLIEELIATKKPVAVSFKSGEVKANFASPPIALDPEYRLNPTTTLPALRIQRPPELKAIQRRNHYRIAVYNGCPLAARVWRIAETASLEERPVKAQELNAKLRDISNGGIGVAITGEAGQPPKVTVEDRLRIELVYEKEQVILEGKMRPPFGSPPPGTLLAGICFKELEGNFDGRRKMNQLTRITGEMQREEMRRARLGIA